MALEFPFTGSSELAVRMRALDWSTTPLGRPDTWPQELRVAVSLCLTSRFPMHVWWGEAYTLLYNTASIGFLGPHKHPEALGRPARQVWMDVWDRLGPIADRVMATGDAHWAEDLPLRLHGHAPDLVFVTFSLSPIVGPDGRPGGLLGVCTETTDKVTAERRGALTDAALRESERRLSAQKNAFELAISGAPLAASLDVLARCAVEDTEQAPRSAFFLVDREARRLHPVPGAGSMSEAYTSAVDGFGIGPDLPACGSAVYYGVAVITPDVETDPLWEPWRPLARAHGVRACWSFPMKTLGDQVLGTYAMYFGEPRDATPRDLDLGATIAQAAAIIASRDREITDRRAAEHALRDIDRRKNEFLATLAHELRNPIAPIANATQMLRLAEDRPEAAARARVVIERQLRHLVRLVDDLLDISRISRGRIELRREVVTLSSVVETAVETSRPLLDAAGHALTVTLPAEPVWLDADLTRLAQVLANLLNNAARYTPERGAIALTARRTGDSVIIGVRDNGIGIPAHLLPHVFDMFTQGTPSDERSRTGLGLGLSIVRRLVEMHGGSVRVSSDGPGRGSEITVRLPAAAAPREPAGAADDRPGRRLAGQRALVVDDNRDTADTLAELLRAAGADVRVAYDGRAALNEAGRFQPTLACLDLGLPDMDGYELARRLRELPGLRHAILVAITGWGHEDDRARSRAAGFNFHVTKPIDVALLAKLLESSARAAVRVRP